MRIARFFLNAICLLLAGSTFAQDLQGRDTASNWRSTHHAFHGIWSSICDEREEYGVLKKRCYIRWVDVYAEEPNFGALFTFVTPRENTETGLHDVMFGPELGTVFLPGGFVVKNNDDEVWRMTSTRCLFFANCDLNETQSDEILQAMLTGTTLEFSFIDPHLRRFDLKWSLDGFADAFKTYETQWALRQ